VHEDVDVTCAGIPEAAPNGGLAGSAIGAAAAGYAHCQHWQIVIPANALELGLRASLAIGAIAGLYPAVRAARLTATRVLRTT
jgi:putative ABC transport system permease protein